MKNTPKKFQCVWFFFFSFYWTIVVLQCSVSFCCTAKWIGYSESEVAQSCPTLCDPMDCSLPGSTIHGSFQARILEWVAISFSIQCFSTRWVKSREGFVKQLCKQDAILPAASWLEREWGGQGWVRRPPRELSLRGPGGLGGWYFPLLGLQPPSFASRCSSRCSVRLPGSPCWSGERFCHLWPPGKVPRCRRWCADKASSVFSSFAIWREVLIFFSLLENLHCC